MRAYNVAGTWSELKGVTPTTNEDTANVVIAVSTEDAVDPHNAMGLVMDAMLDTLVQIHAKAHPDVPEGQIHPFPYALVFGKLLRDRGLS